MAKLWTSLAFFLLAAGPAFASSLDIGPTRVQMIGPERASTITVRNTGATPTSVQVRTMNWSQPSGVDAYAPSDTLTASPPLVALQPGESQIVRLVANDGSDLAGEKAYRLVLDELPPQRAGGGMGIQTAIRALVPVFITPSLQARPTLKWAAQRTAAGVTLTATNSGATRERLVGVDVTAGGQAIAGSPVEGYVLTNASRVWLLGGVPANARSVHVAGEGDFGQVAADVPIGQ